MLEVCGDHRVDVAGCRGVPLREIVLEPGDFVAQQVHLDLCDVLVSERETGLRLELRCLAVLQPSELPRHDSEADPGDGDDPR